ncbi:MULTISPECIES: dipeptidase [Micromonospora]|uniref:Membrane dipeptidase n=1 Tax=Micromonospora chalcea TaxID=1874 RepID=A0ABX9Y8J4_MICCH|nr:MULTISPECIES: membrane dipeptidase [Micromonospora]MBC8989055.1 membrane dipeptidase [Micromonospora chalcea]MBP1782265.1 membrane dipeptidase [Micromonospora sp. HB375]MBQ1062455.1 membrane dipeptidase [Micromonospora sp. C41]MCK1804571.1 dipeptidase [Micromonospora sp. R42106]MCK1830853.1 dipeptidase [Micromonospora sp. R42003]
MKTAATAQPVRSAADLHAAATVVDGSTVIELSDAHLDRIRRGGVTAVNHTVTRPYADTVTALREVNRCRRWIDAHPDEVLLALTVDDIHRAKAEGKEAVILGPQDTEMIGGDLDLLGTFHDLGVRILQLTYQRQNLLGAGCGEDTDSGLTHRGRAFVKAMNELGVLVDVSHSGERTGLDAMDASDKPVVVTHAFCDALSPHIRAKSDGYLRRLAEQGGVMGITTLSGFLYHPEDPSRRPDLTRFVEHVCRVVEVAGVDHVAVATDYDETWTEEMRIAQLKSIAQANSKEHQNLLGDFGWEERRAIGMDDAADFPNITEALLAGGFSPEDVIKILGGNWLRVYGEAWKPAAR